MKLDRESEGTLFRGYRNDLEAGAILSVNCQEPIGLWAPAIVKYLQNLLATFSVLVMLSPFSSTNGYVNFFFLFGLLNYSKSSTSALLDVSLIYFNLIFKIEPLGNSKKIS